MGPNGLQGDLGPAGPSGLNLEDGGTSSGGGGGFLHKNSKPLFNDTQEAVVRLLSQASEEIFRPLGNSWSKEKVIEVFQNIRIEPDKNLQRNENDELLYNYGYEGEEPFIEVLKPFFDYYSTVPVRGPKGDYYYRVQTQIVIELLHEFSHLVMKHPKGDVSASEVEKIEAEASQFAEDFFISLVTQGYICTGDFLRDMFGIKPPEEEESEEPIEEPEEEFVLWAFSKYGERGLVFKSSSLPPIIERLHKNYGQGIEIDDLSFFREESGILTAVSNGLQFPPAPKFKNFFNHLKDDEEIWQTMVYANSPEGDTVDTFQIHKYEQGFAESQPPLSGGLINRLDAMNRTLFGSEIRADFEASTHRIQIPYAGPGESIYRFKNTLRKTVTVDATSREDVEANRVEQAEQQSQLNCQPMLVPIEPVPVW